MPCADKRSGYGGTKMMLFISRYKELISNTVLDNDFCGGISFEDKERLVDIMIQFSEPIQFQPDRYRPHYIQTTNAFEASRIKFNDLTNGIIDFKSYASVKGAISCQKLAYIYSIIELQYSVLSEKEKVAFSSTLNDFFLNNDMPWRIIDGLMIKIDAKQFECDLKHKALEAMKELKDAEPKFQSAYTELMTAVESFEKSDYQSAINEAGKSYESVLKVILSTDKGNADKLTNQYMNTLLTVPETMTTSGFREKVMMSLPYVRNNSGADHGAGSKNVEISKPMAKLAINLAAALDTYLIEEYANKP